MRIVLPVPGPVNRAFGGLSVIVFASEQPRFPAPAITAWVRGQSAVGDTGRELRPIDPVCCHGFDDSPARMGPIRVKLKGEGGWAACHGLYVCW